MIKVGDIIICPRCSYFHKVHDINGSLMYHCGEDDGCSEYYCHLVEQNMRLANETTLGKLQEFEGWQEAHLLVEAGPHYTVRSVTFYTKNLRCITIRPQDGELVVSVREAPTSMH